MRSASLVDFDGDVAGDGAGEAGAGMGGRASLNGDVGVAAGAGGATDLVGDACAAGEAGTMNNGSKSEEGMMGVHPFSMSSYQMRELS